MRVSNGRSTRIFSAQGVSMEIIINLVIKNALLQCRWLVLQVRQLGCCDSRYRDDGRARSMPLGKARRWRAGVRRQPQPARLQLLAFGAAFWPDAFGAVRPPLARLKHFLSTVMNAACCSASKSSAPFCVAGLPPRSPRTSIILAELARQRRYERCRRREVRARRATWLSWLDRRPFDSACTRPRLPVAGAGTTLLVYAA